ncbi:DNA replication/repair protein RecF [Aeromicrobium sp. Leaf350]|uniref:DNA replication/repair protein RecF n=1 Tax=Aeromicrobium sp. Leaf350 TaxID=2876565 RepID=UPI001E3D1B67|nr:DNA replication/repair protein RecF [Aeromicrobium sp. Leaf350]
MHVARLSLHDFRSYADVDVELAAGPIAFIGANGQGKTNLVEAVDYLARLDSHRVSTDTPLVRAGTERAVVRAEVVRQDRSALIEVEINPGRSNRARVNRSDLPRVRDLLGTVRTVLFSPEDLALVKGDPSDRRRFLDDHLVMQSVRLAGVKADYERTLRQRNTLLKSARGRQVDLSTLEVWDEKLAQLGGEITARRLAVLDELAPHLAERHAGVAASAAEARRDVFATYVAKTGVPHHEHPRDVDACRELLLRTIGERRRDELDRGVTLVGPHRDDVELRIGELPAKGYASHGESWSLALALRLASFDHLRSPDQGADDPILILDDVFAELDTGRRDHLAAMAEGVEQVFVTAAVPGDVPPGLQGRRFRVADGKVLDD